MHKYEYQICRVYTIIMKTVRKLANKYGNKHERNKSKHPQFTKNHHRQQVLFGSARALFQQALTTFVDCTEAKPNRAAPSHSVFTFQFKPTNKVLVAVLVMILDSCYKIIWTHCASNHSLSSNSSGHIVNNLQRFTSN